MEKLIYTWEQQIEDRYLICEKIEADGFKPDVIVGISRGGLIPGVMISHKLSIPFKPVHASTRDFPHWENYLPKSNDSKVLIVDDLADSGITLKKSIDWLNHTYGFYIDEPIRTGVLFYKAVSAFKPDYYVDYLKDSPWIHMPYEKYETMKPEELD